MYKDEIVNILEVILEQTETIIAYPEGQISQIELDIVKENIRKLYNCYTILDKVNASLVDKLTHDVALEVTRIKEKETNKADSNIEIEKITVEPIQESDEEIEQPADIEPIILEEQKDETITPTDVSIDAELVIDDQIAESSESKEQVHEIIADSPSSSIPIEKIVVEVPEIIETKEVEKIIPIVSTPIEEKQIITPIKEEKVVKPIKPKLTTGSLFSTFETTSIADQFKDEKKTLHEQIGIKKEDLSIAEKLQQKPIVDLIKFIGINDKFLLIKELFENNNEEYTDAIQLLNNFSTISQAFDYLDILKTKHGWSETSDASLKLYDLIRRKYQK
jgi:hypothetical protein